MKEEEVQWVYRREGEKETTLVLAECGSWEAQLARDVYSKGQVFIFPKEKEKAPDFLGDKKIPEPENLIRLIEKVSIAMVKVVPNCVRVYLAALSESAPLHFWLIPRNKLEHKNFLNSKDGNSRDNDGFTLMADLRNKFVDRQPPPSNFEADWKVYAKKREEEFKKVYPPKDEQKQ